MYLLEWVLTEDGPVISLFLLVSEVGRFTTISRKEDISVFRSFVELLESTYDYSLLDFFCLVQYNGLFLFHWFVICVLSVAVC